MLLRRSASEGWFRRDVCGYKKTPANGGCFRELLGWGYRLVGLCECFPTGTDGGTFEEFVCISAIRELLCFCVPFEGGARE